MLTKSMLFRKKIVLIRCGRVFKQIRFYTCNNYFVTTPIFYVNAEPHIGHLYTAVLADSVARWHELKGGNVIFTTGTDEHGLKIQQAAEKFGLSPEQHCTNISKKFRDLFSITDIKYTDFIRTTENRHKEVVSHFWQSLIKNDHIYKGVYEGWYSVADEAYLSENEVIEIDDKDGNKVKVAYDSKHPVVWTKEDNYMFKLSKFKDGLTEWLDQGVIHPQKFEVMVRQWVDDLEDLSVSRQRNRLTWGIPVPGDNTQTIYVWLDALVNYLTVSGYPNESHDWPPDCHVVGKDILRFHAIYWPAFLLAAGLPLPKRIQSHSHFLVDNTKMSKSRGNVIDPFERVDRYTADGLRYFLLKTGVPHADCNYSDLKALDCLNNDLADKLGNLLNRCTSRKINTNFPDLFPALNQEILETKFSPEDVKMYKSLQQLPDMVDEHYNEYNIYKVIECVMMYIKWANKLIADNKPWQLKKKEEDLQFLKCLIHVVMETLRVNGIILQPIVPNLTDQLLGRLGIPSNERMVKNIHFGSKEISERRLGKSDGVLYPKIVTSNKPS
ncbi:methionine--tRNA ligase, mitochondrial-like isoform X1 [Mytilus galloprovincialis]|uniref:methionine--tRNA ligase, mitochondrial-like isoform X1 n=1 Tax=Mytilus galloprovincialis TaxID=29158 RepID=UPI003F7C537E